MTSSMFETLDILETFNVETEYTAAVNDDDAVLVDTVQVHELTLNKVSWQFSDRFYRFSFVFVSKHN